MRFYVSLAALLAPLLVAKVSCLESPIEGYSVVDLSWEVETTPGGPTQIFNGTIQQVVTELVKINPNVLEEYAINVTDPQRHIAKPQSAATLEQRALSHEFNAVCHKRWPPCDAYAITDGINYLSQLKGKPTNGPGPGNCGRVSCSYNSAIWWCNDTRAPKTLESWQSISEGAHAVNYHCVYGGVFHRRVGGQAFHPTDWNVIVRGENC